MQLHMLGAVKLPPGGLPCFPSSTHLEFTCLMSATGVSECARGCIPWGGAFSANKERGDKVRRGSYVWRRCPV